MGLTLEKIEELLDAWVDAYEKVSRGESVSMGNRSLTRSDADTCLRQINRLERMRSERKAALAGKRRVRVVRFEC